MNFNKMKTILCKVAVVAIGVGYTCNTFIENSYAEVLPSGSHNLQSIENYNVYYGWEYTSEIIEQMKLYDMLILEPLELQTEDRKQIKKDIQDSGTLVYGYMSATEISTWDDEMVGIVTPDDYLYIDGKPYIHWGNNVGDLRKESFRKKVIDVIGTRIVAEGYDGVFLDTLDNYEYISEMKDQALIDELVSSTVQFVKELKDRYPDLKIIQNRAFLALEEGTKNYVDGFMYEDFKTVEGDWYARMKTIVDNYMSLGGKTVFALINTEDRKDELFIECMGYGWKFFCRPDDDYSTWYKYLNPPTDSPEAKAELEVSNIESNIDNISVMEFDKVRRIVNSLPESIKKDELQRRLDSLIPVSDLTMNPKSATSNIDVYIKSENMLSLSLDTNNISFDDFSGVEDVEKLNALNVSVSSSLPYELNAYLVTEIQNSDKSNVMDKQILNIKESSDIDYKTFANVNDKIILKDNNTAGNDKIHPIDIKLKGNIAHKKDVYKATIKFEAQQK